MSKRVESAKMPNEIKVKSLKREPANRSVPQVDQIQKICPQICGILRSLSHPYRLLILVHLLSGRKTVTELVSVCEGSQSQISQYLNRMKAEGLLASERLGKNQFYFIEDPRIVRLVTIIHQEFCPRPTKK